MIVIEIIDIKNFMAHLLLKDTFDHFLLFEARTVTASELLLKGGRRREWYDSDQWSQMCSERGEHDCMHMTWNEMKEIMFHFIKGKKSPQLLYVDLEASSRQREQILGGTFAAQDGGLPSLRMQIRYENEHLTIVPAASYPSFSPDRSAGQMWEEALQQFLRRKKIVFHLLNNS